MSRVAEPSRRSEARARGRRGRTLLFWVLGVGIASFAVGFLFTAVFLFGGGAGDDVVTVPDLRGQTEDGARRLGARVELLVERGASLVNPEVGEGLVLAQSPLPGEEVAPGSVVRITLSAGAERREVPEVRGLSESQARLLLTRTGMEADVEERTDPAPAGRVLEATPSPGTLVELPARVRLVVSSGPPLATVPGVVGMREDDARRLIDEAGFRVGVVEYDPFAMQPSGLVIAQSPGAGFDAPVGSAVGLVVAGPAAGNL